MIVIDSRRIVKSRCAYRLRRHQCRICVESGVPVKEARWNSYQSLIDPSHVKMPPQDIVVKDATR